MDYGCGAAGFLIHPLPHVLSGEIASRPITRPFDFLFFDDSTERFTTETFAFVVEVTVTAIEPVLGAYTSTVRRSLPLTLIATFPPVGPLRNHTVISRDFTEKLADEFTVELMSTKPPIEPLTFVDVHGDTASGTVVVGATEFDVAGTVVGVGSDSITNEVVSANSLFPEALTDVTRN